MYPLLIVVFVSLAAPLEQSARWLKGYIEKGDSAQINKYTQEMMPKADALEAKYGARPEVAKYCAELRAMFEAGTQAAGAAVRQAEIDTLKGM